MGPPVRRQKQSWTSLVWIFGIVMEQNGESKPVMIHLVSKKTNSGPSMQVEDELEIMDDSEDELTVVRSNIMRDYSRGSSGSFDQDCNNIHTKWTVRTLTMTRRKKLVASMKTTIVVTMTTFNQRLSLEIS